LSVAKLPFITNSYICSIAEQVSSKLMAQVKFHTIIKVLFLLFTITVLVSTKGFSQDQVPNLATPRKSGSYGKENVGNIPSAKQLLLLTRKNEEAYKEAQKAKVYQTTGSVLGFAGGFMVGYGIGAAIKGEPIDGTLAGFTGAGGLLLLVSVPFHLAAATHSRESIRIYNNGLRQTSQIKYDLHAEVAFNKIGFTFHF
jgi:hypothetical protein